MRFAVQGLSFGCLLASWPSWDHWQREQGPPWSVASSHGRLVFRWRVPVSRFRWASAEKCFHFRGLPSVSELLPKGIRCVSLGQQDDCWIVCWDQHVLALSLYAVGVRRRTSHACDEVQHQKARVLPLCLWWAVQSPHFCHGWCFRAEPVPTKRHGPASVAFHEGHLALPRGRLGVCLWARLSPCCLVARSIWSYFDSPSNHAWGKIRCLPAVPFAC